MAIIAKMILKTLNWGGRLARGCWPGKPAGFGLKALFIPQRNDLDRAKLQAQYIQILRGRLLIGFQNGQSNLNDLKRAGIHQNLFVIPSLGLFVAGRTKLLRSHVTSP